MSKQIVTQYDPGTPTVAQKLGNFTWAVPSFREVGILYVVEMQGLTCNCPHYLNRLAGKNKCCKHIELAAAAEQAEFERMPEEEEIPEYRHWSDGRLAQEIQSALWDVRHSGRGPDADWLEELEAEQRRRDGQKKSQSIELVAAQEQAIFESQQDEARKAIFA